MSSDTAVNRKLIVPKSVFDQVNQHLKSVFPQEGCGFLAGQQDQCTAFYPIENILHSQIAYRMRPDEQIQALFDMEENAIEPLAIVHSHPHNQAIPSETDLKEATWPDLFSVIVSLIDLDSPEWHCWLLHKNRSEKAQFLVCND